MRREKSIPTFLTSEPGDINHNLFLMKGNYRLGVNHRVKNNGKLHFQYSECHSIFPLVTRELPHQTSASGCGFPSWEIP